MASPRLRGALVVCLGLLLLVGCGGPSKEDFVEAANRSCEERQQGERAMAERNAPFVDTLVLFDRELARAREIEPPEELRAGWERYQQLSRRATDAYRRMSAIEDPKRFNERSVLEARARRAAAQSRVVARRLGLRTCARALY